MTQITLSTSTLALAGLLLFSSVGATDEQPAESDAETLKAEVAEVNRQRARKAVSAATTQAIASMQADNKLDLDIRLIGPTSVKIASKN